MIDHNIETTPLCYFIIHLSYSLEILLLDGWTIRAASEEVHPSLYNLLQLSGGPVHSPGGFVFIQVRETHVYWLTSS